MSYTDGSVDDALLEASDARSGTVSWLVVLRLSDDERY